ncbi:uncharacterized protein FIBRA_06460 [Fibroporia radiculosa]|uniref:Gfo/Idh/MocA-like oxidoreductase C-terminal domain-containing protein n=1 Tax=Fibroporia radiculosa TaxID=599839 RepID=J4H432_9APHY|nr:uncharacterized protein FIBRA_06460 [Fibroporia radiculosa]CCM04289.1 predicted protein [Fibroporia radiculosa]
MVAVVVRTPIHKELAMPVIDAGKSLFVEWPAGRGLKETSELAAAAKKQGIRAMVGMQGRQSPVVNKVKSIIESGEIGAVLSTSVMARCPCEPLFAWGPHVAERTQYTADAAEGASFLAVSVGHFLDLFTYTLGPFASVSATIVNQFPTAELVDPAGKPISKQVAQTSSNQVAFAGTLKRGTVVSMHWRGGLPATPKPDLPFVWTIDGEKGSIRIQGDLPYIHIIEPKLYLNGEEVVPEQDGLTNPARAWAEFAKGPSGSYATLDDAVANKTLLAAIERSAEEGKRIDL